MQAIEAKLQAFIKHNPEFLKLCEELQWARVEIVIKDRKPTMILVKREIKLD